MANPWFRMYSEIIDHESIRLLSFEDRWHYVALLCCKNSGLLDKEQDQSMMMRKLAVKLGLAKAELDSALLRLSEVGLITMPDCQPTSWEKRQYLPNKGLPGSEDSSDKRCYVYFIGEQSSGRVKIGFSRNPWARLTNLQTANSSKLEILCHLRTNGVSESEIHRLLSGHSIGGEWFVNEGLVSASIAAIKAGKVADASALEAMLSSGAILEVAKSVAATVAATTDTDTDTDTDTEEDRSNTPSAKAIVCPHGKIIDLYHVILPSNPRMKVWNAERSKSLMARWREDPKRQSLDYWERFFKHCANSAFLTGRVEGRDGRSFLPGLDWMVKSSNFAKIIENKYHERQQ